MPAPSPESGSAPGGPAVVEVAQRRERLVDDVVARRCRRASRRRRPRRRRARTPGRRGPGGGVRGACQVRCGTGPSLLVECGRRPAERGAGASPGTSSALRCGARDDIEPASVRWTARRSGPTGRRDARRHGRPDGREAGQAGGADQEPTPKVTAAATAPTSIWRRPPYHQGRGVSRVTNAPHRKSPARVEHHGRQHRGAADQVRQRRGSERTHRERRERRAGGEHRRTAGRRG